MTGISPRWLTPPPPGVTGSYGLRAIRWARRELGLVPGPWQARVIRDVLRHDRAGDLIHRIALFSTGRQNGKSVIVRIIVGWMLDEGYKLPPFAGWTNIAAAAHDAKQARIIYTAVWGDLGGIERIGADPDWKLSEWRGIRHGRLSLDTVTGQPGSSRGLSAGLIPWDEMLTQRDWDMWGALGPTQSAQRSPQMILTSTAGHSDSVVLRSFYDRLLRICRGDEPPDSAFYGAWWQADDGDAGLDWTEIRKANPALGDGRLTRKAIAAEFRTLPSDLWKRERLNHFVDSKAPGAFNMKVWAALRTPQPLEGLDGPYAMAVDVQPGWDRATVTVAGLRADGRVGVEVFRDLRPTEGNPITAERVIEAAESFPQIDRVLVIVTEGASAIGPSALRRAQETGYPWEVWKPGLVVEACMDVTEMILAGRLAVDDPLLTAQIELAARRDVGQDGAFRFSRKDSLGAIDGVMAMTFSAHAIVALGGYPTIS